MQADEAELIARSLRHDTAAYSELVERYQHALFRHCYAIMRDEDEAEDVAQETFITAYYKLNTFDQSRRFSTWLFKIATNAALRKIKQHKHTIPLERELTERIVSPHISPVDTSINAELRTAVKRLGPRYRTVISLYYWQGCSIDEIADIMNSPSGSVKGWMSRAKEQLRKELV